MEGRTVGSHSLERGEVILGEEVSQVVAEASPDSRRGTEVEQALFPQERDEL